MTLLDHWLDMNFPPEWQLTSRAEARFVIVPCGCFDVPDLRSSKYHDIPS